jgi:hypothetical protein
MIHLINMHQLALHALHVALMKGQRSQYLWVDSTFYLSVTTNGFNAINHYLKLHLVVKVQWAGSMAVNYIL